MDQADPRRTWTSRRSPAAALIAFAGAGALALLLGNVGQSIGGPLRKTALFAPRRDSGFPVNKTARAAGITPAMTGPDYQLVLRAGDRVTAFTRDDLLAPPPAHGDAADRVRRGLEHHAGVDRREAVRARAARGRARMRPRCSSSRCRRRACCAAPRCQRDQIAADDSMLALKVNGEDLSPDHGYPARVIVPALPGVHNTKWVGEMTFSA